MNNPEKKLTPEDVEKDANWECCRLRIPPGQITHVLSILEGYENHFILRTEDPKEAHVLVWYPKNNHAVMEEVVLDLRQQFPVTILSFSSGMDGLDEVFPE